GDMEAVHEGGKALVAFAQAGEAAENAEIDPRVQPEQAALDAGLPVLGEKIAQALTAHDSGGRRGAGDMNFSPSGNLRPMPRFRWAETKVNENCGEKGPVPQVFARHPRENAPFRHRRSYPIFFRLPVCQPRESLSNRAGKICRRSPRPSAHLSRRPRESGDPVT